MTPGPRLRLIFAGTPEFARVALAQLHAAGHEVVLVLSQPDRPAGRGMKLHMTCLWHNRAACGWMANTPMTRQRHKRRWWLRRPTRWWWLRTA
jgi:hypothetical protein